MKLHIGARIRATGWKTFDIDPGPEVDYVGDCKSLSPISDASVETIYASHVLEHVPYRDLETTLKEWFRVMQPGGTVMIAVPDFETLARLFLHPQVALPDRIHLMQMVFGAQVDPHDFHYVGFDTEMLAYALRVAGFVEMTRVKEFGLFKDTSTMEYRGVPISLNMTARKAAAAR
jgi:predicted SAM-dependent methyltransferase